MPYTREQKKLLLSGYTRLNYDGYVPIDIILLFLEWMSNILYVSIEGDAMQEFLNAKIKTEFKNENIVPINDDISLKYILIPKDSTSVVSWGISAIFNDSSVLEAEFYVESGCVEIANSVYKQTRQLGDTYTSTQPIVPFELCKNKEKLTFYVDAEFICFKAKGDDGKEVQKYTIDSPIYDSHIEYKWLIEGDELIQFKNCVFAQWVYSPNFMNGCIGIFVTPKGETMTDEGPDLTFGIEFYKIPNKIKSMKVETLFKANIKDGDGIMFEHKQFDSYIRNGGTSIVDSEQHKPSIFDKVGDKLIIDIIIDIIDVKEFIQRKHVSIAKSEWHKYGVIVSK